MTTLIIIVALNGWVALQMLGWSGSEVIYVNLLIAILWLWFKIPFVFIYLLIIFKRSPADGGIKYLSSYEKFDTRRAKFLILHVLLSWRFILACASIAWDFRWGPGSSDWISFGVSLIYCNQLKCFSSPFRLPKPHVKSFHYNLSVIEISEDDQPFWDNFERNFTLMN